MTRIPTPATIAEAPEKSQHLLEAVKKQLGVVPNLFRAVSNSPQALEGYLAMSGALGKGALQLHTYLARNLAKLDDAEITANRNGASNDLKADAAVRFRRTGDTGPRPYRGSPFRSGPARRIHRRAGDRDHPARRPQHVDQLLQRGLQDRH